MKAWSDMKMHTKCPGLENVSVYDQWVIHLYVSFLGRGFAIIATKAEVPIVPIFLENVEEMRWNPFLYLWNLLGLGRLFSYILKLNIPCIGSILVLIASTVWFLVTFIQIPLPAKLTMHIGDPVPYDMSKDSIDDVSVV